MDETMVQDKTGFFSRMFGAFTRTDEFEEEVEVPETPTTPATGIPDMHQTYRYTVTVRKDITCFEDALAAAHGLKRGEQQILNLAATDATTRQKIVDFMCGVNFAQDGTWEEIGEYVYMVAPNNAYIEVAPPTPRMSSLRN